MSVEYAREWVAKAEADYKAALTLHQERKPALADAVCFHCQQCAEKYLKAFLACQNVDAPRIHSLAQLNDMCQALEADFSSLTGLVDRLDPYAVEIRYPGVFATLEEAQAAVEVLEEIRSFIRARLDPEALG